MSTQRVNQSRPGVSYAVTIGVKAPDYEVDRSFWKDGHYEGVSIFRDSLVVTLYDPTDHTELLGQPTKEWLLEYYWLQRKCQVGPDGNPVAEQCRFTPHSLDMPITLRVPLYQDGMNESSGQIKATLRMEAKKWD
ncbi:hypothetical protein D3C85_1050500 [compost metagenome]